MNRSQNYTIAAILQFVISVFTIVMAVPLLARGSDNIIEAVDSPPYFIVMLTFVIAVLGLASAYGVWRGQRWGVILTIVLRTLDGLSALPGILFALTPMLQLSAIVGVILSIVVIALLLWPKPRLAKASEQA